MGIRLWGRSLHLSVLGLRWFYRVCTICQKSQMIQRLECMHQRNQEGIKQKTTLFLQSNNEVINTKYQLLFMRKEYLIFASTYSAFCLIIISTYFLVAPIYGSFFSRYYCWSRLESYITLPTRLSLWWTTWRHSPKLVDFQIITSHIFVCETACVSICC